MQNCHSEPSSYRKREARPRSLRERVKQALRGVLFADLFKLLVPGGPAVVRLLPEPGDHIRGLIRVDHDVVGLRGTDKSARVSAEQLALLGWTLAAGAHT